MCEVLNQGSSAPYWSCALSALRLGREALSLYHGTAVCLIANYTDLLATSSLACQYHFLSALHFGMEMATPSPHTNPDTRGAEPRAESRKKMKKWLAMGNSLWRGYCGGGNNRCCDCVVACARCRLLAAALTIITHGWHHRVGRWRGGRRAEPQKLLILAIERKHDVELPSVYTRSVASKIAKQKQTEPETSQRQTGQRPADDRKFLSTQTSPQCVQLPVCQFRNPVSRPATHGC